MDVLGLVAPSPGRGQLCSTAPGLPAGSVGWMLQCKEMLWAASVPSGWNKASYREGRENPCREQRVQGKAKGTWRKARWELLFSLASTEAAPSLPLPPSGRLYGTSRLRGLRSPCRRPLAPTKDGKGRTPRGLNSGLPQNMGRTLAPQVGGRPWQCCARGSQVRHCIPRMPLPPGAGSSL